VEQARLDDEDITVQLDELSEERRRIKSRQKKRQANVEGVTDEMVEDVKELLALFGMPWLVAPMEAEAQVLLIASHPAPRTPASCVAAVRCLLRIPRVFVHPLGCSWCLFLGASFSSFLVPLSPLSWCLFLLFLGASFSSFLVPLSPLS
jgi:hypothetical protein